MKLDAGERGLVMTLPEGIPLAAAKPVQPFVTEAALRAIKAEAHKLWFDALNPYCDHMGIYPEVAPEGMEQQTVVAFVQQILDPLIANHQDLMKEVQRLRVELAARGPRLHLVEDETQE